MGLTLKCPIDECCFEVSEFIIEEAISHARDHLRIQHNLAELPPHILEKITWAFKPELW